MALEDLHTFQRNVREWCVQCFGEDVTNDVVERTHRFFEEAAELCQALGMSRHDADTLLDYVYGRPAGEPKQEVGGTMVTLAALASAANIELDRAAVTELMRILGKVDEIRAKHATKAHGTPLPGKAPEEAKTGPQVIAFPRTSLNDIPAKLRALADRFEKGDDPDLTNVTGVLVAAARTDDWPVIYGYGDQSHENHPVIVATQVVHWFTTRLTRRKT